MNQADLITASLQEIGVNSPGESPSQQDLQTSSVILNHMLDSWQADRLYIFAIARQVFVPATLKQVYTLGPGGDFNVPRPAKIERYGVLNLSNPIQPIELPLDNLTAAMWGNIPVKNISSALPQRVWDDQQFPLRNLSFWPVPNVQVNFTVYSWVQLNEWLDFISDLTFPPGYLEAIRYSLAIRLAPSFGAAAQVTPLLLELARNAVNKIRAMNAPMMDLKCDPMLVSPEKQVYDWRTDTRVGNG